MRGQSDDHFRDATGAVLRGRLDGVDIGQPVAEPAWGEIRAAFDEHSVLVFRGQRLDDEA